MKTLLDISTTRYEKESFFSVLLLANFAHTWRQMLVLVKMINFTYNTYFVLVWHLAKLHLLKS